MPRTPSFVASAFLIVAASAAFLFATASVAPGQQPPYDLFPAADPPYYRVRYEAATEPGGLIFSVNYTVWIPPGAKSLRGVIVHQHGCGEGSCKSGLTGAFDLHWQALAKKHDCALLAPAYEQPEGADCQMWCDPRNGSAAAFEKCLVDLGTQAGRRGDPGDLAGAVGAMTVLAVRLIDLAALERIRRHGGLPESDHCRRQRQRMPAAHPE